MTSAVTKFLIDVQVHFPRPKIDKTRATEAEKRQAETVEKEWFASMVRLLNGYSADTLDAAAKDIIANRKDTRFPLPAECKAACDKFAREEHAKKVQGTLLKDPAQRKDHGEWRYQLADELIACELGRRAAREGWCLSLHDFIRKNARLPTEKFEIANCIASARGFDEAYRECVAGNGGALGAALSRLGDTMLRKREDKRRMILGE